LGNEELARKVELLETKIKELENRIEGEEAVTQIMNIMANYEEWHCAAKITDTWKLFAQETPGVSAEIDDWGVWIGIESIRRFYELGHKPPEPYGGMMHHHLDTYVIQVAKDRKTAKAIFWSPGHESWVAGDKKFATWCWGRYGCDFVKEKGGWKIWHLKWYGVIRQEINKSWQEPTNIPYGENIDHVRMVAPPQSLKTTYHNPYTVKCVLEVMPPYPEPYETWDNKGTARGPVD